MVAHDPEGTKLLKLTRDAFHARLGALQEVLREAAEARERKLNGGAAGFLGWVAKSLSPGRRASEERSLLPCGNRPRGCFWCCGAARRCTFHHVC